MFHVHIHPYPIQYSFHIARQCRGSCVLFVFHHVEDQGKWRRGARGDAECVNSEQIMTIDRVNLVFVGQFPDQTDAQDHDEETNGHDNQQDKSEPTQHHGRGTDAALDAAITHVLGNRTGRDRRGMLP